MLTLAVCVHRFIYTMMKSLLVWLFILSAMVLVSSDLVAKKGHVNDLIDVDEVESLLERQIPDDIVYDLSGRKKLITRDDLTDEFLAFSVTNDENGLPVVIDPDNGHKYLVKSSIISKDIELYRLMRDVHGQPIVADWKSRTINRVKFNKYKEVELMPAPEQYSHYRFGDLEVEGLKPH